MKKRCVIFLCSALMMLSCGEEKKKPIFYDSDLETETESYQGEEASDDYQELSDAEIISVPFTEKGGVKFVNVSVNGFGFQMIFDTGCSSTLISVAEANYLYQRGYLTENDIVGVTQSQIADGSIVENMVVNLKEVIIDNQIKCTDVMATVSANNNAPLLLGNEVLDRVAAYAVDNQNKTINFKLK